MSLSSQIFQHLKPICVCLAKDPNIKNLQNALMEFQKLHSAAIQEKALLEYAIFPFKLAFKRGQLSEEQEILCFQSLQTLFQKSMKEAYTEDILLWALNTFSIYFTSKEMLNAASTAESIALNRHIQKSEEQKLALVNLITSLLKNTSAALLLQLYCEKYLPLVGHVVSIIINLIELERSKELQEATLICLKLMCGFCINYKLHGTHLANFLASFFPGIALLFNNVFTSSEHQSNKVITTSLDTFAFVISIVLNDRDVIDKEEKERNLQDLLKIGKTKAMEDLPAEEGGRKIKVTRNNVWFEKTSTNMKTVFNNIFPVLMIHKNIKARVALLEFLNIILVSSMDCLVESVPDFLDVLAKLSSDSYNEVKQKSQLVLESATLKYKGKGNRDLNLVLQEKLQSQFLSLPRIMNGANDDIKLAHLHIIKGYLFFFGETFKDYLYSSSHLETFFSALLQVLELQTNNISVVEERTNIARQAIDFESSSDKQYYRKDFCYFSNSNILTAFKDIIYLMVKNGDIDLVIDYLLGTSIESTRLRKQTIFVLNEVITCCKSLKDLEISSYIEQILQTYLQEKFWKVPVTNDHLNYLQKQDKAHYVRCEELSLVQHDEDNVHSTTSMVIPFESLHSNVQLVCLLLEGIAIHASVLKTSYNIYLIQSLYPVLEKVGSVNATISQTALQVLNDISVFCNYESVADLILFNSDYLINSVTLQFRHLVYGTAAPCVLSVILKLCNSDIMPVVCDVIEDVFQALDDYQEEVAEEMLNVLKYFAIAVDKWYNDTEASEKSELVGNKEVTSIDNNDVSLSMFLSEYSKLLSRAHGIVEDENENTENPNEEDSKENNDNIDEDVKKETPLHFQIIIKSLAKCNFYIAAHLKTVKLKALEVANHSVVALSQRENDLLPSLHKVWPAIIHRLKDPDLIVVLKTLDVVCCMVSNSGDFLRKRLSTEFLPFALSFLRTHQSSFTKNKSQYTQLHKVLNKLILFLGDILPHLDVGTKQFCDIASACLPFLSCNLHESVQSATVCVMIKFYEVQPDVIWLLMTTTSYTMQVADPPHPYFPTFTISPDAMKRNVYSDSISKVFDQIYL